MPISSPERLDVDGLVWSVTGTPHRARTVIALLNQGPYADCLRESPDLREVAVETLRDALVAEAPVDTGMLRDSIRIELGGRAAVSLGPNLYDRTALKTGRVRGGKVRRVGYYALPANDRSHRPGYVERSVNRASAGILRACSAMDTIRGAGGRSHPDRANRPALRRFLRGAAQNRHPLIHAEELLQIAGIGVFG